MAIWQSRSVDKVPEVVLTEWRILETSNGDKHLIGHRTTQDTVRISSAIVNVDWSTRTCATRSGRRYVLEGAPSADLSASELVWEEWCRVNRVDRYRDVTAEVLADVT